MLTKNIYSNKTKTVNIKIARIPWRIMGMQISLTHRNTVMLQYLFYKLNILLSESIFFFFQSTGEITLLSWNKMIHLILFFNHIIFQS